MNDIIDNTIGEMPEASESAIDQERMENDRKENLKNQYAHIVDAKGNPFDPELHEMESDGSPRLTKRGKAMRRRGRVAGKDYSDSQSTIGTQRQSHSTIAEPRPDVDTQSRIYADATCMIGVIIGGPDWAPKDWQPDPNASAEYASIQKAWANFLLDHPSWINLSTTKVLVGTIAAYALPRLNTPLTKSRMKQASNWAKEKYATYKIYGFKGLFGKKDDARFDNGNDDERKNDNGKGSG